MAETPKTPSTSPKPTPDIKNAGKPQLTDPKLTTVDNTPKSAEDSLSSTKETPGLLKRFAQEFFKDLSNQTERIGGGLTPLFDNRNYRSETRALSNPSILSQSGLDLSVKIPNVKFESFRYNPIRTNNESLDKVVNIVLKETIDDLNKLQSNVAIGFSFFSKQIKQTNEEIVRIDEDLRRQKKSLRDLRQDVDKLLRNQLYGQQRKGFDDFEGMSLSKDQKRDAISTSNSNSLIGSGISAAAGAAAGGATNAIIKALPSLLSGGMNFSVVLGLLGLTTIKRDAETDNGLRTKLRKFLGIDDPHEPAPWLPGGSFGHPIFERFGEWESTPEGSIPKRSLFQRFQGYRPKQGAGRTFKRHAMSLSPPDEEISDSFNDRFGNWQPTSGWQKQKQRILKRHPQQVPDKHPQQISPSETPDYQGAPYTFPEPESDDLVGRGGQSMTLTPPIQKEIPWWQRGRLNPFNPENISKDRQQGLKFSNDSFPFHVNMKGPRTGVMDEGFVPEGYQANIEDRRPKDAVREVQNAADEVFLERASFHFIARRSDILLSANQGSLTASARDVYIKGEKIVLDAKEIELTSAPQIKPGRGGAQRFAGGGDFRGRRDMGMGGGLGQLGSMPRGTGDTTEGILGGFPSKGGQLEDRYQGGPFGTGQSGRGSGGIYNEAPYQRGRGEEYQPPYEPALPPKEFQQRLPGLQGPEGSTGPVYTSGGQEVTSRPGESIAIKNQGGQPARVIGGSTAPQRRSDAGGQGQGPENSNAMALAPISGTIGRGLGSRPSASATGSHQGVDIIAPYGSPVYAVKPGVVVTSNQQQGIAGNVITVKHDDGTYTKYLHLSERGLEQGARVNAGQIIGRSGTAGGVAHLHYERWSPGEYPRGGDESRLIDPIREGGWGGGQKIVAGPTGDQSTQVAQTQGGGQTQRVAGPGTGGISEGGATARQNIVGGGSAYLTQRRAPLFAELDKDPQLKDIMERLIATENRSGAPGARAAIAERMFNAAIRDNKTLRQTVMESGFYGPIEYGTIRKSLSAQERAISQRELEMVRKGSHIIDFRTDQGMWQPGHYEHPYAKDVGEEEARLKNIGGEWFSDQDARSQKLANIERQRMQEYDRIHPSDTQLAGDVPTSGTGKGDRATSAGTGKGDRSTFADVEDSSIGPSGTPTPKQIPIKRSEMPGRFEELTGSYDKPPLGEGGVTPGPGIQGLPGGPAGLAQRNVPLPTPRPEGAPQAEKFTETPSSADNMFIPVKYGSRKGDRDQSPIVFPGSPTPGEHEVKGSWYGQFPQESGSNIPGGWVDPGDINKKTGKSLGNWSGSPQEVPGIALPYKGVAGGPGKREGAYARVTSPDGQTQIVPVVDLGPNQRLQASKDKGVDINAALAERFGYAPNKEAAAATGRPVFPTGAKFKYEIISNEEAMWAGFPGDQKTQIASKGDREGTGQVAGPGTGGVSEGRQTARSGTASPVEPQRPEIPPGTFSEMARIGGSTQHGFLARARESNEEIWRERTQRALETPDVYGIKGGYAEWENAPRPSSWEGGRGPGPNELKEEEKIQEGGGSDQSELNRLPKPGKGWEGVDPNATPVAYRMQVDPQGKAASYGAIRGGVLTNNFGWNVFGTNYAGQAADGIRQQMGKDYNKLPPEIKNEIEGASRRGSLNLNKIMPYIGPYLPQEKLQEWAGQGVKIYDDKTPGPVWEGRGGTSSEIPQQAQAAQGQAVPIPQPKPTDEVVPIPRPRPPEEEAPPMNVLRSSKAGEGAPQLFGEQQGPVQPSKEIPPMEVERSTIAGEGAPQLFAEQQGPTRKGQEEPPPMEVTKSEVAGAETAAKEAEAVNATKGAEAVKAETPEEKPQAEAKPVDIKSEPQKEADAIPVEKEEEKPKEESKGGDGEPKADEEGKPQGGSSPSTVPSHSRDAPHRSGGGSAHHRVGHPYNHPEDKGPEPEHNGYGSGKSNPSGLSGICAIADARFHISTSSFDLMEVNLWPKSMVISIYGTIPNVKCFM